MSDLIDQYCAEEILTHFPKLRDSHKYKECAKSYGEDVLFHNVTILCEEVFCDYILNLLHKNDVESQMNVKRAFLLLENLLKSNNEEIYCVAYITIECFLNKILPMDSLKKYLGPKSLECAEHIIKNWLNVPISTWKKQGKNQKNSTNTCKIEGIPPLKGA